MESLIEFLYPQASNTIGHARVFMKIEVYLMLLDCILVTPNYGY